MSERGRTEKKDTTSRVKRGLRSMSARRLIPGLPKLNRARGKVAKNKRSKEVKQKSKIVRRTPPPQPCQTLIDLLADDKEFVLWLGQDFEAVESPNLKSIFLKLAEYAEEGDGKTAALALINQKPEDDESNFAAARDSLRILLGHARFNALFAQALAEAYPDLDEYSVSLKLVRALKPTVIVYGGVDRALEDNLQHDNLSVNSLTALEVFGLKSKSSTEDTDMKDVLLEAYKGSTIILKPEGDFSKPDSLLISKPEKFGGYGLTIDGEELTAEAVDPETKTMMALLKSFADSMPIVFLGQDLSKGSDPVAHLLKAFRGEEATDARHVALVKSVIKEDQRFSDAEVGVNYQVYKPHSSGTQIAEFMSQLVGFRTSIPEEDPDIDIPFTASVVDDQRAAVFISSLADKESVAKTINIFANSISSVPFLLPNDYEQFMEKKLKLDRTSEVEVEGFNAFIHAVEKRTATFNNKLVPRPDEEPEAAAPVEETEEEATEEAVEETAETPAVEEVVETPTVEEPVEEDNTRYPACINLLLPVAAGVNAVKAGGELELEMLQKLKNIVVDSQGRLELRFIEAVTGNALADDFELLYLKNAKADYGDMALYQKQIADDYVVNFYENNTNASEEKVLLFERMWTQSMSHEESMDMFEGCITDVQAAIEEAANSKNAKKKGFFGIGRSASKTHVKKPSKQSVKKPSKASNVDAEGKPKRDGIIKRIVKTVTTRRHSKITQAPPSATAAKEEVAAPAEEEAVVEEAPVEEAAVEEEATEAVLPPPEHEKPEAAAEEAPVEEAAATEEAAVEEPKEEVAEEEKKPAKKEKKKNNWKIGFTKARKKKETAPKSAPAEEEATPTEEAAPEETAKPAEETTA